MRHEAVQESVPENAKNMLLVLASSGILTPHWKVRHREAPGGGMQVSDVLGRSLRAMYGSSVHAHPGARPVVGS